MLRLDSFEKAKSHSGRTMNFGQNLPKLTGMDEMSRNGAKLNSRWNREYYRFDLHAGTRNSGHFDWNKMKFITLISTKV